MTPLDVAQIVLALAVVLVVGALTFVWARRRFIAGDGRPVMLCARRDRPMARWRLGLARLGSDRFEWFSVVGPSLRPEVSWARGQLDLGIPLPLRDPIPGLVDPVAVKARAGSRACEFAFVPAAYTAVRAWLESSPPGYNSNVA